MTELANTQGNGDLADLNTQMKAAELLSQSDIVPQAYRGKPANILVAANLGSKMGLAFAESLYRIDVIQGSPTAGAELIASNVRRAGHKLRVYGDEVSQTAQIVRADDPEFVYEVTRDEKWAKQMGLTSKDNYKKQMGTMLQWRAITAAARLACPEALFGVSYVAEELRDFPEGGPKTSTQPKVDPKVTGVASAPTGDTDTLELLAETTTVEEMNVLWNGLDPQAQARVQGDFDAHSKKIGGRVA